MSEVSEEGNMTSLELLRAIYRNPEVPLPVRMRAAMASLPFEVPKLAVVATVNAGDFADQLEQAVKRSRMVQASPITNGSSNNVSSASETANGPSDSTRPHVQGSINGKPSIVDRRYRSW